MFITKLELHNWRNFLQVSVTLTERVFIVGPNASGKSNLLDAFRFLRDIADSRGGFQHAVEKRGGVSKIRSLHSRSKPTIVIDATLVLDDIEWRYRLEFKQDNLRRPKVVAEQVWKNRESILKRPDDEDKIDEGRLAQTHLEQVNANRTFRIIADFFAQIRYLHIVPQLIREPDRSIGKDRDPYGGDFLEQLADMEKQKKKQFESRLTRMTMALKVAVPQLEKLELCRDASGRPHLRGLYSHWRPQAGWQNEDQFSDGTLRLFGLLWALLDGTGPLLLEEPELSLHEEVIRLLPSIMYKITSKSPRQIVLSTHSANLLSDHSIDSEEVLMLTPSHEDTSVTKASSDRDINALLIGGLSIGSAVMPRVAPKRPEQILIAF